MTLPPRFVELHQSLPSRAEAISPFVAGLMRFIKLCIGNFRNGDERNTDIEIALQEAVANAVIHGNQAEADDAIRVVVFKSADADYFISHVDVTRIKEYRRQRS